jgi:hypothetical protein
MENNKKPIVRRRGLSGINVGHDVRFRWMRNGLAVADASSKSGKITFNSKVWRDVDDLTPLIVKDEYGISHEIPNPDVEDVEQIPATISHESLHFVLKGIESWEANHALDKRELFGFADAQDASGVDMALLDSLIGVREGMATLGSLPLRKRLGIKRQ